ncbi:MAG: hypothetical protein CMK72_03540 [Pseudomonadaceae bacterium]|nr:hypothetical protein [Pseudomonadaceae bacterium]HCP55424.1 hypothetical protein [Pseudomonas sp.]
MVSRTIGRFALTLCASSVLASQAATAGLFDEGQATLRYANYPWIGDTLDEAENVPSYKEGEWTHALELKYSSGYLKDFIGFDVGAYGVDTLATKDDATRFQNIQGEDDDGYGGLNNLYLKAKWQVAGVSVNAGYGKKRRTSHLYDDSNTRIIDATTVGADVSISGKSWSAYSTFFNKASQRNQDDFGNDLETFQGEKIDYIGLAGGSFKPTDNLRLDAEYLEAKDYIRRSFFGVNYLTPISPEQSFIWDARYGTMNDAGSLFERVSLGQYANDPDGLDASFNQLALTYKNARLGVTGGVWRSDVSGGDFNRLLFKEDHGWWDSDSRLWQWFALEGETAYGLSATQDLARYGLPGFSFTAIGARSNDADGFDGFSRQEWRTIAVYQFQSAILKGLSIAWLHIDHRAEGTPDGVRRTGTVAGPAALAQGIADRVYMNYIVKF